MSPGIPGFSGGMVGGEHSESKPVKHRGSTVPSCAALPETACMALAAAFLTGTSVSWTRGEGKQWVPRMTGAADMPRLLASLRLINRAISEVSRGKMNPANELTVHPTCPSLGSKVGMFNSRHPPE